MRFFRRILGALVLFWGLGTPAFAQWYIPYPSPDMMWYGNSTGVKIYYPYSEFGIAWGMTQPSFRNDELFPEGDLPAPGPPGLPLSDVASWHNMVSYVAAMGEGNLLKTRILELAKAKNKKNGADPLVGKGPASLSFWQWVKMGQAALETYSKIRNIQRALMSGRLEINVWKLAPKMAFINESDEHNGVIFLALAPTNKWSLANVTSIFNANSLKGFRITGELKDLVPSLATKPSFFDAVAHVSRINLNPGDVVEDATSQGNNALMAKRIHFNFHEVMVSLGQIQRMVAGMGGEEMDGPDHRAGVLEATAKQRGSPAYIAREVGRILNARQDAFTQAASEVKRGMKLLSPGSEADFDAYKVEFINADRMMRRTLEDVTQRRSMDWWGAKQASGTLSNIVMPLETAEYLEQAKKIEDMIRFYLSDEGLTKQIPVSVHQDGKWIDHYTIDENGNAVDNNGNVQATEKLNQQGDADKLNLALSVTDAWVNRLVRDEMRALRQIYTATAQMEGQRRLAPHVAKTMANLQEGAKRLEKLQKRLANAEATRADMNKYISNETFRRGVNLFDSQGPTP